MLSTLISNIDFGSELLISIVLIYFYITFSSSSTIDDLFDMSGER